MLYHEHMHIYLTLLLMLAPVLIVLLLRANSALVFAAICIGFAATHFISSHDIGVQLAPYIGPAKDNHIQLVLAFLPAVAVLVATLRSRDKGLVSLAMHALPALGIGFLTISMALPFLSDETRGDIVSSNLWHVANSMQGLIVGLAALASLILLILDHRLRGYKGK